MSKLIEYTNKQEWLQHRLQDITSTESPALFGMSPYLTAFELFHRKRDQQIVEIEENERMKWGTRLEPVIASGVAEDMGWRITPLKCYIRHDDCRMGSSFDYLVEDQKRGVGILEIKNVDFLQYRDNWIDDGENSEAPEHIEIQLQHQLEVSRHSWGAIVPLVGGNAPKVIIRERDLAVGAALRAKIGQFWRDVETNNAPLPNFKIDADFICKLNSYAEPGKFYQGDANAEISELCERYKLAALTVSDAEEEKKAAKAQILQLIGDAEKCIVDGFNISAGVVGPCHVSYDREGYRNFRVTAKKS